MRIDINYLENCPQVAVLRERLAVALTETGH
jgi:hypothetical protein